MHRPAGLSLLLLHHCCRRCHLATADKTLLLLLLPCRSQTASSWKALRVQMEQQLADKLAQQQADLDEQLAFVQVGSGRGLWWALEVQDWELSDTAFVGTAGCGGCWLCWLWAGEVQSAVAAAVRTHQDTAVGCCCCAADP
jgi:hypothetical protein